jgi:hypothetical protein
MAFVYREKRDLKVRPATALGPGEYLPLSESKIIKSNKNIAPFESQTKKFSQTNILNTPGPGTYYKDKDQLKIERIQNEAETRLLNQEEVIQQEKNIINNQNTNFHLRNNVEKLGFDIKDKRFKEKINDNPGPGKYFTSNTVNLRAKSAKPNFISNNRLKIEEKKNTLIPSIPYNNDKGFDINDQNELVKIKDAEEFKKFNGDNKESVGPGTYQIDDPEHWHRTGTAWSKMKSVRLSSATNNNNFSKNSTRPQTGNVNYFNSDINNDNNLKFDIRIVSANPSKNKHNKMNMNNLKNKHKKISSNQNLLNQRSKRQENIKTTRDNINSQNNPNPIINSSYLKDFSDFQNKNFPGPGYYIDIEKNSDFYLKSFPYPENKQFFLSNMERFPYYLNGANNFNLGPTTYFQNNEYYNSAFNTGQIEKNKNLNKIKNAPFNTRQKRFTLYRNEKINLLSPGPGAYDPKLKANIEKNNFNNKVTSFNLRQKRFGPTNSNLKWQMNTPGPGSYINPYTATGTANTVFINGLYVDTRKGKEIIRPKSQTVRNMKNGNNGNNSDNNIIVGSNFVGPDFGTYDADKIYTIAYNNKKKAKNQKENNEKLNIAFDSHNSKINLPDYDFNNKTRFKDKNVRSNIGPGFYYKEKTVEVKQIYPPFHDSASKNQENQQLQIGPGYYDPTSYFDWNKKSFNITFI